jgi:hypothetical protein
LGGSDYTRLSGGCFSQRRRLDLVLDRNAHRIRSKVSGMSVVVAPAPDGVTAAAIDAETPKR